MAMNFILNLICRLLHKRGWPIHGVQRCLDCGRLYESVIR
jgi:hypothetical protein